MDAFIGKPMTISTFVDTWNSLEYKRKGEDIYSI